MTAGPAKKIDTPQPGHNPGPVLAEASSNSLTSVVAIVTFWVLAIWSIIVIWVMALVSFKVAIEGTTLGVLAGVIGTQTTITVAAVSFWIGTTVGAKAAGDKIAAMAGAGLGGLTQLAGAGAPPPAPPPKPGQEE